MTLDVYFERSNGERILLKTVKEKTNKLSIHNIKELTNSTKVIEDFLKSHNYKSYYWNCSLYKNEMRVDVGSYTEFFYIKKRDD